MANDVIKPRSKFDRQLARIEQMVVWENASGSVRENLASTVRLAELAEEALKIGNAEGASPTIKLRSFSVARDCIATAADIRTKTIIDRTIPALNRTELSSVIAALPVAAEEERGAAADPIAEKSRRLDEALARAAAALTLVDGGREEDERAAG